MFILQPVGWVNHDNTKQNWVACGKGNTSRAGKHPVVTDVYRNLVGVKH